MKRADPSQLKADIKTYIERHMEGRSNNSTSPISFENPTIYMLLMRAMDYLEQQEEVLDEVARIGSRHSL